MADNKKKAWMCAIGSGINFVVYFSALQANTLFIGPISKAYGCSVTAASVIYSTQSIGSFIMGLIIGKLITKYNPRLICILGSFTGLIYYGGMAVTSNIYLLWVLSIFNGFGLIINGIVMNQILVSNWFSKEGCSTVVTVTAWFNGFLKMIMAPVIAMLIKNTGMREAAMVMGIVITSICLIDSILFISNFPKYYGMKPIEFGRKLPEKMVNEEKYQDIDQDIDVPLLRIIKMPAFWIAMMGMILWTILNMMHNTNASLIYQNMGVDFVTSAYAISLDGLSAGIFGIVFGILYNRLGVKKTMLIFTISGAAVMFIAPYLRGFTGVMTFAVLVGGIEICNFYGVLILPRAFGKNNVSTLIGWASVFGSAGAFIGPPLSASLAAMAGGSYRIAQMTSGFMYLAIAGVALFIFSNSTKTKVLRADNKD